MTKLNWLRRTCAACMMYAAAAIAASAQTYRLVHAFTGGTDGALPEAGLFQDSAGNLYGTTVDGGDAANNGTVFKIDRTGKEAVLYRFTGGTDGGGPYGGLIGDSAGNLYGTAWYGGVYGYGAVYKLDTTGVETVLYSFSGTDGSNPFGSLVRDAAGNLYGATDDGGLRGAYCCGTVFELDPSGKLTTLHTFTADTDGKYPAGSLVRDAAGNLYGTTGYGGARPCDGHYGCGTVFKVDTARNYTVLHRFGGVNDGEFPVGGLAIDSAGNLYGATEQGGDVSCDGGFGCGTVFKLDPTGTETILYNFTGGADGGYPYAGLVMDAAGNLYGTTGYGGDLACNFGCGTVFKLDTTGKETVLYSFTGGRDGSEPMAGLLLDAEGNLYGTTYLHGDHSCSVYLSLGCGTVFGLKP